MVSFILAGKLHGLIEIDIGAEPIPTNNLSVIPVAVIHTVVIPQVICQFHSSIAKAQPLVKPTVNRAVWVISSKMPLSEDSCLVSRSFKILREDRFIGSEQVA